MPDLYREASDRAAEHQRNFAFRGVLWIALAGILTVVAANNESFNEWVNSDSHLSWKEVFLYSGAAGVGTSAALFVGWKVLQHIGLKQWESEHGD